MSCVWSPVIDVINPLIDEIDQFISPMDIEAIEVYRSASEVPARFTTAASNCGVILIWSRRGR